MASFSKYSKELTLPLLSSYVETFCCLQVWKLCVGEPHHKDVNGFQKCNKISPMKLITASNVISHQK